MEKILLCWMVDGYSSFLLPQLDKWMEELLLDHISAHCFVTLDLCYLHRALEMYLCHPPAWCEFAYCRWKLSTIFTPCFQMSVFYFILFLIFLKFLQWTERFSSVFKNLSTCLDIFLVFNPGSRSGMLWTKTRGSC